MTDKRLGRKIATMIALAGLGVSLAACVSDLGAATGDNSTTHQMRYYGGPKSPMWPSQ
ncbi:hypothetical protein M2427_006567 [Bradyrhizobium sp. BR13661]|jgi:hypothetical protein|nr:hypothetical protein [Bradyrhizobium sp. BR13661]